MLIKLLSCKCIYKYIRYKDTHFRIKKQIPTRISLKNLMFFIERKGFALLRAILSPGNRINVGGSSQEYVG